MSIINELRPDHNQISETGYAAERIYRELYEGLEAAVDVVVVMLDEVEKLGNDDKSSTTYLAPNRTGGSNPPTSR